MLWYEYAYVFAYMLTILLFHEFCNGKSYCRFCNGKSYCRVLYQLVALSVCQFINLYAF